MKRNKFNAKKTEFDGLIFDSAAEANRWKQLLILQGGAQIWDLQRQVKFELAPGVKLLSEKRARPAIRYIADFVYRCKVGIQIVEDVKSPVTARLQAFRIKQHLMKTVHGIEIRITS